MRKFFLTTFSAVALVAAVMLPSCVEKFGEDCSKTQTCVDASLGGSTGSGGAASGSATGGGAGAPTGGTGPGGAGPGGSASACEQTCPDAKPVCDKGECVECTVDDDDECDGAKRLCDPSSKSCVECIEHEDCGEATASRCETGACVACVSSNPDCAHIESKGVCKADAGACVQCTSDTDCSGGSPCNLLTNKCSEFGKDRKACESCDTDANCATAGHYCVPMEFNGEDRPGGYCLKSNSGGCTEPYSIDLISRTSLSGLGGLTYCGLNEALTTCEAVRALQANRPCPGGSDSECPQGGSCRQVGSVLNRCTYACGGAIECLQSPTPGSTCGDAPDNNYCGG